MAALIDKDREPSERELRWFGALFLGFATAIAALVFARSGRVVAPLVLWGGAASLATFYYAMPTLRRALLRAWVTATYPLGWLGSYLALGAFFYLVLTPLGLLLRAFGRDALERRFEPGRPSYWVEHRSSAAGAKRYWHQY